MTTPFSSTSPDGDAPTEDFSANVNHGDASPTETGPRTPTEPYPASVLPPRNNDSEPNFFTPPTDAPAATPAAAAPAARLRPRFATILWGVLLLAFATYMAVFTLLPVPPDPTLWLLGGVIAVGLGLVVAGIAAAARHVD